MEEFPGKAKVLGVTLPQQTLCPT